MFPRGTPLDASRGHPSKRRRTCPEKFLSQLYEEGSGFTDDLTRLTKDNEEVPTEISGAALNPGADGTDPARTIAMLRDISERVEHRRELEEKIERLDRFASIVSHDLRNPLSIIQGRLTLARETGDSEHFDPIDEAVDRIDEMLSELPQLTREGDVIGDRTTVTLETLARQAWTKRDADTGTLEIDSSGTISAERGRACELLENPFENAVEHAGTDVTVRIGTIEAADESGFCVEDDGTGIVAFGSLFDAPKRLGRVAHDGSGL